MSRPGVYWETTGGSLSLVGDIDNNGTNEIVNLGYDNISVINGSNGNRILEAKYSNLFSSVKYTVTGALLCDVDNNSNLEIVICFNGQVIVVLNNKLEIMWQKDFGSTILTSEYMTATDLNQDHLPELLLDNLLLNLQDGAVIRTNVVLGTVADVNGDGNLEVVTKNEIFDSDFNILATCSQNNAGITYPILADLNDDGLMEIISYDEYGLYVFDKDYSLIWCNNLPYIKKVVVGDCDGDGKQEIITARLDATSSPKVFELNCFSDDSLKVWSKTEYLEKISDLESYRMDMGLNDLNNDG
jgi:hypothetical protein